MKIVTGIFAPEDAIEAMHRLTENGFSYDDLSMMSSDTEEVPAYLENEPEKSAASGAAVGAAAGGSLGVLGAWVASVAPGLELVLVNGLLATAAGSVVGGYLGSLYSVHAKSPTRYEIHEELEAGNYLLLVKVDEASEETAVSVMEQGNGQYVETHTIPADEAETSEEIIP